METESSPENPGHTQRVNDIEMYYEIRGEGEPLVLLHGGGGVGANWELIFKEPPQGYRLVILDLRGHGRSTNPSMQFTFRQSALDVVALLDHLGIDRFKAIGLSMGAKTLLHVATMHPDRIEAMVLVSAAPYFPEQARAIMRETTPDNRTDAEWQQMRQWHRHGDEQIRAIWRQANGFKDSYDDMNFTPPYLATISARTASFGGAGTLSEFRNRGVQKALLLARLAIAAQSGCDLAMVATMPGSDSQRNVERLGFRVVYTRTKFIKQ